jgi:lantibiotic transport system permease protein
MLEWINIFIAEMIKQKRSLTILVIFLAPGLMVIFNLLVGLSGIYGEMESGQQIMTSVVHNSLNLWALIMLPMAMTLLTALNANVEYRNNQWKYVYSLPVSPWKVMMLKWLINIAMAAFTHLLYFGLIILTGLYLCTVNGKSFVGSLDYIYLLQHLGIIFMGSILLTTIHTLAALTLENFLTAMSFGTLMMISNYFVAQSVKYGVFSPWAYPMRLNRFMTDDPYFWIILAVNLIGSFLLATIFLKVLSKRQILT